jgi:hypothetical protein
MTNDTEEFKNAGYINIKTKDPCERVPDIAEFTAISPLGKKMGLVLVDPGMYTKNELICLKKKQLPLYDVWKCICYESNYEEVSEAVGSSFCVILGTELLEFLLEQAVQ